MTYSCNLCKSEGREFKVPADEIGQAIMEQHLNKEHSDET